MAPQKIAITAKANPVYAQVAAASSELPVDPLLCAIPRPSPARPRAQ